MAYIQKTKTKSYPESVLGFFILAFGLMVMYTGYPYNYKALLGAGIALILSRPLLRLLFKGRRKQRLLAATESIIYNMDGVEFEDCCIEHFRRLGYSASPTAVSGDYGADIILKKHGRKTVVQCKRYKGKVGVAAVQEVLGAKGYYKADYAMVVTNSFFTPNAVRLAKANGVELWDRDKFIRTFNIKRERRRN